MLDILKFISKKLEYGSNIYYSGKFSNGSKYYVGLKSYIEDYSTEHSFGKLLFLNCYLTFGKLDDEPITLYSIKYVLMKEYSFLKYLNINKVFVNLCDLRTDQSGNTKKYKQVTLEFDK